MLTRVKKLFGNLAIYGLGDVSTSLVSLLLLPIFTRTLSKEDYGVITMLAIVEQVTKVLFRWGVDTAYMRLYFDCGDERGRQRLASTLCVFLLCANGALMLAAAAGAGWLAHVFSVPSGLLVTLTIFNTFVAGFFFLPLQTLRINNRPREYSALTFSRSAATVVARLVLVIGLGWGVLGIVMADIFVTLAMTVVLLPWYARLIRPMFSTAVLREALRFGLPRVPHTVAQQVIGSVDRVVLNDTASLGQTGLYGVGSTFGLALKLFASAFEAAWTPFFLAVRTEPDAKKIYSTVSTYVVAALAVLVAGLAALASDALALFAAPKYHDAALVTPWIALGAMCQGLYVLGSIGLIITKRTSFYPVATGIAAAANVVTSIVLIPRYGMVGAAWSNLIAYGLLALVTSGFSLYVYPIRYEWSRLLRITFAGLAGWFVATRLLPADWPPIVGFFARGVVVLIVYGAALFVTGFFHAGELRAIRDMRQQALARRPVTPRAVETEKREVAEAIAAVDPETSAKLSGGEPMHQDDEPPAIPGSRSPRR